MSRHRKPDPWPAGPVTYLHGGVIEGENRVKFPGPPAPPVEILWTPYEDTLAAADAPGDGPAGPLLPTEAEFARLPRTARLAFAARCARRVAPVYRCAWPDAPADRRSAVRDAVRTAEDSTAAEPARAAASFAAAAAADAAAKAGAVAAFDAARTVARATAGDAAYAARSAADTLVRAATVRTPLTRQLRAIRRDFDHLAKLAAANGWTNDTPVTPETFGPMWPDGPPAWWADDD